MTEGEKQVRAQALLAEVRAQLDLMQGRCVQLAQELALALADNKRLSGRVAELEQAMEPQGPGGA